MNMQINVFHLYVYLFIYFKIVMHFFDNIL